MTVTTTTQITGLSTVDFTGYPKYVIAVNYTVTGTDGVNSTSIDVSDNVGNYDPDMSDSVDTSGLIPYADLTQQTVLDWVLAQTTHDNVISALQQNDMFAPTEPQPDAHALPW
jgi:hypothetical protein